MPKFHLWTEDRLCTEDVVELAATLEKSNRERLRLWFRLPSVWSPTLSTNLDSFVLAVLFNAMGAGADLEVHGEVSPSLLTNLVEFQRAWALWLPGKYHPVDILAGTERDQPRVQGNEIIMGFSGGVDSSFTAWQHRPNQLDRQLRKLVAGVIVHGFDIPIDQPEAFSRAAEKAGKMLGSIDVNLISVSTNLRELRDNWLESHAAALAACLMLFQGKYNAAFIASAYSYDDLVLPCGSNPVTDQLLSNDSFRIIHDGAAFAKVEKIRCISDWPEARQYLRVCWQGPHKDSNCCRCQKCVSTMLLLRAIGQAPFPAFPFDISDWEISHLKYPTVSTVHSADRLIKKLKSLNFRSVITLWALKVSVIINRVWLAKWRFPWLEKEFLVFEKWWFVNRNLDGISTKASEPIQ